MQEEGALVLQGSVATVAFAFFREAVLRMVPYAVPGFVLLVLDLLYGVRAAKHRGEKVRLSTAVRRSTTKFFSYVCWLILASTLALSFEMEWLEWAVLGLVYGNELASIIGNYLETKGIEVSWSDFYRWIFKAGAEKIGATIEEAEAEGIIRKKEKEEGDE